MKKGLNKVTLVGNVGDSPRINETKEKMLVANFSVATNDLYRDKEGKEHKTTEWHRIVAWDKKAEVIKTYIKKGDPIYIEGKLRTSSYDDKEGVKKYVTEVYCDDILFLPGNNNNNNS